MVVSSCAMQWPCRKPEDPPTYRDRVRGGGLVGGKGTQAGGRCKREANLDVKSVLKSMQVVYDETRGRPTGREVVEHASQGGGRGNLPLLGYTLHGARGVEGKDDRQRLATDGGGG